MNGKLRAVSVFVTHQARIMENTIEEIHAQMLELPMYLEFRTEYMALNPRLPPDWQVSNTIDIYFNFHFHFYYRIGLFIVFFFFFLFIVLFIVHTI